MRLAFLGTPDFAVQALAAIVAADHDVTCVYSQPPAPRGRGHERRPSPVHAFAETRGIPVRTPASMRDPEAIAAFRALDLDAAVVVAFGQILPAEVLEGPRLGSYNVHASLLPRWRGAAPIQRAIMAGDAETGMMVMKMDEGLDTGPVAMTARVAIGPEMTGGELHDRLATTGADLMVDAMSRLARGELALTAQPAEGVTYAKKIDKAEARIDWARPAPAVHDTIRALSPFPGAWCEVTVNGKVERLKVLRSTLAEGAGQPGDVLDDVLTVACGTGAVRLAEVQRAGGRPMAASEFLHGVRLVSGDRLA